MGDLWIYGLIGAGAVGLVLIALLRPTWLKPALVVFGVFVGAGVVHVVMKRQRRFQELGAAQETAGALARLTVRAEQLQTKTNVVIDEAKRDQELRDVQTKLTIALQDAQKEHADVEAIREEIRRAFPGF